VRIDRHDDPIAFRDLVTPWLMRDEARYNLLLALVARVANGEAFGDEPPVLLTVHDGDALAGLAVRTPPYNVILDAVPLAAAAEVAAIVPDAPGALGPPEVVRAFAEATGRPWRTTRREGIHRLGTLVPARPTTGTFRLATEDDGDVVDAWEHAFVAEVGLPEREAGVMRGRIADGLVWVWDDGGVVSLAGCGGTTPNGARVGPVYTPPEHRGRGYASAVTAGVTRALLDRGMRYTFLYTDLANPTSNKIYADIGYERIADVDEVTFGG
jgi:GNAT superfamily N-acetyltransferase